MISTIAAVVAWLSSLFSLIAQAYLAVKNRTVLRSIKLWHTAAIGIFIAFGFFVSYLFILFSPPDTGSQIGRSILRWFVPCMMFALALGTYWSIQTAMFIGRQHEMIQQKMDFISIATHELGTPLTSIFGYYELLSKIDLPEEAKLYLDGLHSGTARLRVIKRYNDALQKSLDIRPFELCEAIQGVIDLNETWAATRRPQNSIPLHINCSNVLVELDRERIETAIMIMVSNALKATKTAVWINAETSNDFVIIQIQDDGLGIEEFDLQKLFKPMTQLDLSSTRQFEGVGMGLYTLSQIAKLHDGTVKIRSSESGTIINLILPIYHN